MNLKSSHTIYHVIVAIRGPDDFRPLLNLGYSLARANQGRLTIITVRQTGQAQEWLKIDPLFTEIPIETKVLQDSSAAGAILKYTRQASPNLLVVGWKGNPPRRGHLLGNTTGSPGTTHPRPHLCGNAYPGTDTHPHLYLYPYRHTHAHRYRHDNADRHAHLNFNPNRYANRYGHTYANLDLHSGLGGGSQHAGPGRQSALDPWRPRGQRVPRRNPDQDCVRARGRRWG